MKLFLKHKSVTASISHRSFPVVFIGIMGLLTGGCKKLTQINEPINTITSTETFSNDVNATSAVTAIYSDMSYGGNGLRYANGLLTIDAGLSADELKDFSGNNSFELNKLQPTDGDVTSNFWSTLYYHIYMANAVIEGLQKSALSDATKSQLTGEAKFVRAFCYFYLANLFGDVPLVTTTAWAQSNTMGRIAVSDIYQQVITDLADAQSLLPGDYTISAGQRARPSKFAATALLARVYLYQKSWSKAEEQASLVINNSLYSLVNNLDNTFLKDNSEAIWQLQLTNTDPYATKEGNNFISPSHTSSPRYYLTNQVVSSFETGDQRRVKWVDSTIYSSNTFYFPFKFKVRQGTAGNLQEYYTPLRLAEQYLIRAEARAQAGSNLSGAISDLNMIRNRAGLLGLPSTLNQSQVLAAVAQENRVEFFAEWGHRWFDLKRTSQADAVLGPLKVSNWQTTDQLWPIPLSEIQRDANLKQNSGY